MIDIDKIRRSVGMVGESTEIIEILNLIGEIDNTDSIRDYGLNYYLYQIFLLL